MMKAMARVPEYEDGDRGDGRNKDRDWIVAGRIADFLDVDRVHFHSGVEEKDAGGQDDVVEVAEVWNEVPPGQVDLRMTTAHEVSETEHDQDEGRDDRADDTAPLGHPGEGPDAAERDEGGQPVDRQDDRQHEHVVGRECLVPIWLGPVNASDTAPKVSPVGNHTVTSIHNMNIATKAHRGPNASPTQRNTPPFSGHPVASSAATSDTGMRKTTAANR